MMVLFRSSFVTAAFVCIVALGQFATVYGQIGSRQTGNGIQEIKMRQIGMRPKLRVLGVDASGSDISSILSATATASEDGSASSAALSTASVTPETGQTPDSSSGDDPGTDDAAQTSSAASPASGFGVALLAASLAALIQTF